MKYGSTFVYCFRYPAHLGKVFSLLDWVGQDNGYGKSVAGIWGPLRSSESDSVCNVDLSHCGWLGPGVIAGLAAFVDQQSRTGRPISFKAPQDLGVANYLARIGLGELLASYEIDHHLPTVRENGNLDGKSLVKLKKFSSTNEVDQLLEIIDYQQIERDLQRVCSKALAEAGNNVPEHARVEHGFLVAQVTNAGKTLCFAVADSGVGIMRTLEVVGATSDGHAIRMALEGQSEDRDNPTRGRGLPSIRKGLAEHGGEGTLVSGNSLIRMVGDKLHPWSGRVKFTGTILEGHLPIRIPTS